MCDTLALELILQIHDLPLAHEDEKLRVPVVLDSCLHDRQDSLHIQELVHCKFKVDVHMVHVHHWINRLGSIGVHLGPIGVHRGPSVSNRGPSGSIGVQSSFIVIRTEYKYTEFRVNTRPFRYES
jgi:hypothetical protein